MKMPLAITDLTRMQRGCVCIAGYDKDGHCHRPTLPRPGIKEASLYAKGQPIVFPLSTPSTLFRITWKARLSRTCARQAPNVLRPKLNLLPIMRYTKPGNHIASRKCARGIQRPIVDGRLRRKNA